MRKGGDIGPVTIEVDTAQNATTSGSFRVLLGGVAPANPGDPYTAQTGFTINLPDGPDDNTDLDLGHIRRDDILPIVGNVVVDTDETTPAVRRKLGTPVVINPGTGLIEFPLLATITAEENASIVLSYETSNQETALVNVQGDRGDTDVLLVESAGTPGEYTGTFVVRDLPDVRYSTADLIVDEQHSIPSDLEGYKEIRNESISKFYNTYTAATGTLSNTDANATETTRYARVANPPIRDGRNDDGDVDGEDISISGLPSGITAATVLAGAENQGILSFTAGTVDDFDDLDDIDVDYFGSDTFTFTVNHGPVRLADAGTLEALNGTDGRS